MAGVATSDEENSGATSDEENSIWHFKTSDTSTDMKFVVEGKHIHFYKALLVISSPVFSRMFSTDFTENYSNIVDLPDKKFEEIVQFLEQLHPAYAWQSLKEEALEYLLKLADEYDVKHVKTKCQSFMREQMEFALTTVQVLKYLWLCDTYSLEVLRADLITLAADHTSTDLERCSYFSKLQASAQLDVMKRLCHSLEGQPEWKRFIDTGRFGRKMKLAVKILPGLTSEYGQCRRCVACEKKPDPCDDSKYDIWCKCKHIRLSSLRGSCSRCLRAKTGKILEKLNAMFEQRNPPGNNSIVI